MRLAVVASDEPRLLADGTQVLRGDPIGELHLWNEHLPQVPEDGPDLHWARELYRREECSLSDLAHHMQTCEALRSIQALRGDVPVAGPHHRAAWARTLVRLGFEIAEPEPLRWPARWHQFWASFLALGLLWAFNPVSLQGKGWTRQRLRFWMSRGVLLDRYANPEQQSQATP
jgi:hypothetical protein